MPNKTKGQVEAQISEAMIKFEKDYMGRGPIETKTYIIKDMILVRLKGVLSPAEEQLAKTVDGAGIIKNTRRLLREGARDLMGKVILDNTGCQVISQHTDISTKTGERVFVFILDKNLEERFV